MKKNIAKFYSDYKLYIFPLIVTISCLILIIFVIYPQVVSLITNQKKVGDFQLKAKFLDSKAQALEGYNQPDLNQKVSLALSSVPADKDFANVLTLIQTLAAQSGFNIVSLALGGTVDNKPNQQSYSVKLELLGPKSLVANLISGFDNSSRIMRVNNIEVSSGKDSNTLDVALVVYVLYSPIPSNFGSIDSPLPEINQKDQQLLSKLSSSIQLPQAVESLNQLPPRGKVNPFE